MTLRDNPVRKECENEKLVGTKLTCMAYGVPGTSPMTGFWNWLPA